MRLRVWSVKVPDAGLGFTFGPWSRLRNRGVRAVMSRWGATGRKVEGGVFFEERREADMSSSSVIVEGNPMKGGEVAWRGVGQFLAACSVSDVRAAFVERVDVAFDCDGVERWRFLLDVDRSRKVRAILGPDGFETEEWPVVCDGRGKPPVEIRLYDKARERRERGGENFQGLRTRLEYRLRGDEGMGGPVQLGMLANVPCPAAAGRGVRVMELSPSMLGDARFKAAGIIAGVCGLRAGRRMLRELVGERAYKTWAGEAFSASVATDESSALCQAYSRGWSRSVERVLGWVLDGAAMGVSGVAC